MKYFEIKIETTSQYSEIVADKLFELGCQGVQIEDYKDVEDVIDSKIADYFEESILRPSSVVYVKSLFDDDTILQSVIAAMNKVNEFFDGAVLSVDGADIEVEDWVKVRNKFFKPLDMGGVVICPEWENYVPTENQKVVKLVSAAAFGTGQHQTTSMCVELMQEFGVKGKNVIDLGCGSGILGVTALVLGAKNCLMLDNDPMAVEATKQNCQLNAVNADVVLNDLLNGINKKVEIITANLTASLLLKCVDDIARCLKDKGLLIASGVLEENQQVFDEFVKKGFTLEKQIVADGWRAAALRR